ncbi:DUF393 domain-containing protein [Corynebacterium falsenii]|uniref:DCC1-like thiol-disulfide oxidoreductase family protein n=1 Tax=Corynebacterium falsenii TaxID=108486 RepID=UPI001CCAC302|nr:DUF393 domain-containing protein [Corynebacterium falsenii]
MDIAGIGQSSAAGLPLSADRRGVSGGSFISDAKPSAVFFFDGDCGFCQWSAEHLRRICAGAGGDSAPMRIEPAWKDAAPSDVAPHIERFAVYRPAWDESAESAESGESAGGAQVAGESRPTVYLGHKAIGTALRRHGRTTLWRLAGRVLCFRPLSPLFRTVYRLVANNRHRLGPLVGVEACVVR